MPVLLFYYESYESLGVVKNTDSMDKIQSAAQIPNPIIAAKPALLLIDNAPKTLAQTAIPVEPPSVLDIL